VRHGSISEPCCECSPEVVTRPTSGHEYDFVLFLNLEVENRLEHVVNDVDVKLQILISQLVVEPKKTAK